MKRLIVSLCLIVGALALMVVAPIAAKAADKPAPEMCSFMTLSFLIEQNRDIIVKLHTVEGERFKQFLDKVNFMRAQNKLWPLEAVGMVIAEFKNGKIGTALVDKNTCVVPGTISGGSIAEVKIMLGEIGFADLLDVVGTEGDAI